MSSEDEPIAKNGKSNDSSDNEDSSSEDDIPISQGIKSRAAAKDDKASESDSSDDDDVPIAAKKKSVKTATNGCSMSKRRRHGSMDSAHSSSSSSKKKRKRFNDSDESDDDDDDDIASSSEDDVPIIKAAQQIKTAQNKPKPPAKKKARVDSHHSSDSNSPSCSSGASTPRKRKKSSTSVPGYVGRECNDASNYAVKDSIVPLEPEKGALKWWEHEDDSVVSYSVKDDSKSKIKWHTLDHNGVVFAPEYEAHGVPMKYDGKTIKLTPDQEEVATHFALMIDTDWAQKAKFRKNFMKEFVKILTDKRQARQYPEIVELVKCDFTPIAEWWQSKKEDEVEKKKDQEYKDALKEEKAEFDSRFGFALVDGILEKVGNYKVEPPGLFRGRGEHPKMGLLKQRILPKHIILNIGENTPIPPCPIPGQKWGGVIHDKTVTYIAKWIENINGQHKFVYLGASSRFKGEHDRKKYEKARVLKTKIAKIRKDYESKLTSKSLMEKQLATAVWMIDKLSIRVGNEKDTDEEADTVGVCSLRKEHMTLLDPSEVKKSLAKQKRKRKKQKTKNSKHSSKKKNTKNSSDSDDDDDDEDEDEDDEAADSESSSEDDEPIASKAKSKAAAKAAKEYKITLDFLGKDSMRYHQTVAVTKQVYANLRSFLSGKKDDMDIFEKIDPNKVNDYLRDQMEGLTAKVFRTHNASTTLQQELGKGYHPNCGHISAASKLEEKIYFYNQCNMQVAILCNHQRSVSKTHAEQLQKMDTQIQDLKDAIAEMEEERDILTGKKKARKTPKKKTNDDDDESPSKKKRVRTEEQLDKLIPKKQQMLRKKELQKAMKEDNKEVALGTSKINYMDPRITVSWCKKMKVPIEKIFNKSLLDKFPWAMQSNKKYLF